MTIFDEDDLSELDDIICELEEQFPLEDVDAIEEVEYE